LDRSDTGVALGSDDAGTVKKSLCGTSIGVLLSSLIGVFFLKKSRMLMFFLTTLGISGCCSLLVLIRMKEKI
jgi:hypothetical protein